VLFILDGVGWILKHNTTPLSHYILHTGWPLTSPRQNPGLFLMFVTYQWWYIQIVLGVLMSQQESTWTICSCKVKWNRSW